MPQSSSSFSAALPGRVARLRAYLPPLNFITIHYAYFIIVPLAASLVFWGSSEPAFSISYPDSLFLVVSAMTESGLNTVNLSQMTTWQQAILFLLICVGGSIWVSIWTVAFRKHVFEQRFAAIVRADRIRADHVRRCRSRCRRRLFSRSRSGAEPRLDDMFAGGGGAAGIAGTGGTGGTAAAAAAAAVGRPIRGAFTVPGAAHINFAEHQLPPPGASSSVQTPGNWPQQRRPATAPTVNRNAVGSDNDLPDADTPDGDDDGDAAAAQGEKTSRLFSRWNVAGFLSAHTTGRNSQFHSLSRDEREQLGGCEYRALQMLSVVVPLYFVLWHLLGCLALGAWIRRHKAAVATANGINPWWLGIFNGASAFNNSGMSLLDANMIPFEQSPFVLLTMGLMILAGNTAYPVFLRLLFWCGLRLLRWATAEDSYAAEKDTLEFILRYPRRVYTNLFPARPTWWLLFMIVLLNCVDWVAFELLNFGNAVIESIPLGSRVLDGLFQAIAVRSGGFYVVPITEVYIGLQVLYVIMMYISVYPVVITMRHSNVYEERSLGIYAEDPITATVTDPEHTAAAHHHLHPDRAKASELGRAIRRTLIPWHGLAGAAASASPPPAWDGGPGPVGSESRISFISQQIHGQLAHDLWWLVLAVLVIATIETSHFLADPVNNSVFNIIFEVVSAYGCVGISTGVPDAAYSFSGSWHNASKIILCLVMIRGRHRGLPVALDRAVRLPGAQLHEDEEEDHQIRQGMALSRRLSGSGGGGGDLDRWSLQSSRLRHG